MGQPKHVLFGDGAPTPVQQVTANDIDFDPPDSWTQILDLRNDPDQNVVRRLTLFAYRNFSLFAPDAPSTGFGVSVIDDSITTGVDAVLAYVTTCVMPPPPAPYVNAALYQPVKILDDYPVRGPVRVIAGASVQTFGAADATYYINNDFVVIFGYYTVDGEEHSDVMLDPRPPQIGNTVPTLSNVSVASGDLHETTEEYVDEFSFSKGTGFISVVQFGDPSLETDPYLRKYLLITNNSVSDFFDYLDHQPIRDAGTVGILAPDASPPLVQAQFSRY